MKTKSKLRKVIIIVAFVIIAVLLIYRILLMLLTTTAVISGDKYKAVDYYSTIDECITASLEKDLSSIRSAVSNFPTDGHDRYETLFSYENDKQYAEIFISDNEYDIWIYVLDKADDDGNILYCVSDCHNSVQLQRDEWRAIGDFRYMTVFDLENQTYDGIEPEVTKVRIKTVNGYENLYVLFVDVSKE